ncbi:hypothetical protein DOY81_003662, partial [Sarcophaga bullata]
HRLLIDGICCFSICSGKKPHKKNVLKKNVNKSVFLFVFRCCCAIC